MSCIQQNFPSKFEPNDAFYEKLEQNTFVAFILRHPVGVCLKFCRRPYQAKLTTIQHNFNPTISGGGGSYILNLGLTLPGFI